MALTWLLGGPGDTVRGIMRACTLFVAVGALVACGDNASTTPDAAGSDRPAGVALCYVQGVDEPAAATAFNAALAAGAREARVQTIADLEATAAAAPDDERAHLYLGLAHLWRLAEPLTGETELNVQVESAVGARDHLEKAYSLCPTDHRIPAWLGPILVRFGRAVNNQATIDRGLAVLDQGIANYPSFVLFSKLLVFADFPRDSSEYQQAIDAIAANIDACSAGPLDPACSNRTVPHNLEGGGLFLGDAMAKAGRRDAALSAYSSAASGPDFAGWRYQAEVNARVTELDTRVALFANADTADDPKSAWQADRQCGFCHER